MRFPGHLKATGKIPGIPEGLVFGVDYQFEAFQGGHFTNAFERLEVSLGFISDTMN